MKTNLNNTIRNVADEICNKTMYNKCEIYSLSLSVATLVSSWDSIFFQHNNGTIETSQFRQLLCYMQLKYRYLWCLNGTMVEEIPTCIHAIYLLIMLIFVANKNASNHFLVSIKIT